MESTDAASGHLPPESVWNYPRPPALRPVAQSLRIELGGRVIAQTREAWRVLETSHPPVYYLPPDAFRAGVLEPVPGSSYCEWKGIARYWTLRAGDLAAVKAGWSYPEPTAAFAALRDHVAVYAGPMGGCFVGDERVTPQPGGFYGGWITRNLLGPFKGVPGSAGW